MAIAATDVDQLQTYADGVISRAGHHAGNVKGAAYTVLGGIVWHADADITRNREYAGSPANMLWIKVDGRAYALRYEHSTGQIKICDGSQKGTVLHNIDDTMPVADIHAIIKGL